MQQEGKARLNLRKRRDVHVSTASLPNAIVHFWSFPEYFLELVLMQGNGKVWGFCMDTGVPQEMGGGLKRY